MSADKLLVTLAALVLLSSGTVQATIYVAAPPFGDDASGTGTPTNPYATIQHAYNQSPVQGETIVVAPGTYNECVMAFGQQVETSPGVFESKWVTIRANHPDSNVTTIAGDGFCTTVTVGGFGGGVEGFTITGGGDSCVRGIGTVRIEDNIITGCVGVDGAGIHIIPATCQFGAETVEILANVITNNSATNDGGGINAEPGIDDLDCQTADSTLTIHGNTIENNVAADDGGGLKVEVETLAGFTSGVTITENTVRSNEATSLCCSVGGGVRVLTLGLGTETILVHNNIIDLNQSSLDGGGVVARIEATTNAFHQIAITDNVVTNNTAMGDGGGIQAKTEVLEMLPGQRFDMIVTNNVVDGNVAAGNGFGGGGILGRYESRSTLVEEAASGRFLIADNVITHNSTNQVGGGLSVSAEANVDPGGGGGCYATMFDASAQIDVEGNLIAKNSAINVLPPGKGGGVGALSQACVSPFTSARINFLLNTIVDNQTAVSAGGIELGYFSIDGGFTGIDISHTIVADNEGIGVGGAVPSGNTGLNIEYCNVVGNLSTNYAQWIGNPTGSNGNVTMLPHFSDPAADDYHLVFTSPMIDLGNPTLGVAPLTDVDGNPRIADGDGDDVPIVDIGYDEYYVCQDPDLDGFGEPGDSCEEDNCPAEFNPGQSDCDLDLFGDVCDPDTVDADEDGVDATCDANDNDPNVCGDFDFDTCEDCESGVANLSDDGLDSDLDGLCDAGDPDDDNDGVDDELDSQPLNRFRCRDADLDSCDDCSSGLDNPANDGPDAEADGLCDVGDPDDDNDGVEDSLDSDPLDAFVCRDADLDTCDDCSSGLDDPANDGDDWDADGACDAGDPDDDNDGIADESDPAATDPTICGDVDADLCDDCSVGTDGTGPLPDSDWMNDGADFDADGQCDLSDLDDDNDGVDDDVDGAPSDPLACSDVDLDGCDDCALANLRLDFDFAADPQGFVYQDDTFRGSNEPDYADGSYEAIGGLFGTGGLRVVLGGVDNFDRNDMSGGWVHSLELAEDTEITVRFRYNMTLSGAYEDSEFSQVLVSVNGALLGEPPNDYVVQLVGDGSGVDQSTGWQEFTVDVGLLSAGTHTIIFGGYNNGKTDADEFTEILIDDVLVGHTGGNFDPADDGTDTDSDGLCDLGDPDDDNDGVADDLDSAPLDFLVCGDLDLDTCDDCSGGANLSVDATFDADSDGFSFADDTFRGTSEPDFADGNFAAGGGFDGGGLHVFLGGVNNDNINDMSGGWIRSFDLATPTDVTVRFRYQFSITDSYEGDEYSEVLLSVDGVLVGSPPNDYVARLVGDGGTLTTGWQQLEVALGELEAGNHTIAIGGYNNKKTDADEFTDIYFDNVEVQRGTESFDPADDGLDADGDGSCAAADSNDEDPNVCSDVDADTCDDCTGGLYDPSTDGADFDADGSCDAGDPDDDDDGVPDEGDSDPFDANVCTDSDFDTCDDCSSGTYDPLNDGVDTDEDGVCAAGDNNDEDASSCRDLDVDLCDDCSSGVDDPTNDGIDLDEDGLCDAGDPDDDNDGVDDDTDPEPQNPDVCGDSDGDSCEDCLFGTDDLGPLPDTDPANDGLDTDLDGLCDVGDPDDDNDGINDESDPSILDPDVCGDSDGDTCDDCAIGSDDLGPLSDAFPENDGTDTDSDGACDDGDGDDDNDGIDDELDPSTQDPNVCGDSDGDTCDDCTIGTDGLGPESDVTPDNDGTDTDSDGACDDGDDDDDNDGIDDALDPSQQDPNVCGDSDGDTCDDCAIGTDGFGPDSDVTPDNDGTDTNSNGVCDDGDPDDDSDGVEDGLDPSPQDPNVCGDTDGDTCDDCTIGTDGLGPDSDVTPDNDGTDTDSDGACDAGDPDDDNDGIDDEFDPSTLDPDLCGDADGDLCDDCTIGTDDLGPLSDSDPANDGVDFDLDGLCDLGDPDDDNDGAEDSADCAPFINSVSEPMGDLADTVAFGPEKSRIVWLKDANANVYNVYRGEFAAGTPFFYNHTCFATEVTALETSDLTDPPTGAILYYLVSGTNVCGGEGGLGTDSSGLARPNAEPCLPLGNDSDGDDILDISDNCPLDANPLQEDGDADRRGDLCDNCPSAANIDQKDTDLDGPGDVCDTCTDLDDDGFGDPGFPANTCELDNCPSIENPGQDDTDADGLGNACDVCVEDPNNDIDGDGVCANDDNCPDSSNPTQADGDDDGLGDACDPCFANPDVVCTACPEGTDPDGDGTCQEGSVIVQEGTAASYLANVTEPNIDGVEWTDPEFVLGLAWQNGTYGFGYDTGGGSNALELITTTVPEGTASIYTLVTANLVDASDVERVQASADFDDGYMVWINGIEVFRSPEMPQLGTPEWNTSASQREPSNGTDPDYGLPNDVSAAALPALQDGSNRIAIGVWNTSANSSDLLIVPLVTFETSVDNCPAVANPGQEDADGDTVGDLCDNCPFTSNFQQVDSDADGLGDLCDPCEQDPNPTCACPPGADPDGDGVCHVESVLVEEGSAMDYLANSSDPGIVLEWTEEDFTLTPEWQSGIYGVGYDTAGSPPDASELITTPVEDTDATSIYTRATFEIDELSQVLRVLGAADFDDGYVMWINGTEVYRSPQMPPTGDPLWNTPATSHESSNLPDPDYGELNDVTTAALTALHTGTNVLAVGVWNVDAISSDLVLVPRLSFNSEVDNCPGTPNPGQEDTDGDGIGDACDPE